MKTMLKSNALRRSPAGVALAVLLLPIGYSSALAQTVNLRRDLRTLTVPAGALTVVTDNTRSLSLPLRSHQNFTADVRTESSAASWYDFSFSSRVGQIGRLSGTTMTAQAGGSIVADDVLTLGGTNPGANAIVDLEMELTGHFAIQDAMIPAAPANTVFNNSGSLRVEVVSSRGASGKTINANLNPLVIASPAPRPRTESTSYPFRVRGSARLFLVVGETFTLRLSSGYSSDTFTATPAQPLEEGQFGVLREFRASSTSLRARLTGLRVLDSSVLNPTLTGTSGTDYAPLLQRPTRTETTFFSYDPTTRGTVLEWQTPHDATASFTIRRSADLSLPFSQWTLVTATAPRASYTSTFQTVLPDPAPARQFFRIMENP